MPANEDRPLTVTLPDDTELDVTAPACTPFNEDWPLTVTEADDNEPVLYVDVDVTVPACTLDRDDNPLTVTVPDDTDVDDTDEDVTAPL
jgi:hypothetical protein